MSIWLAVFLLYLWVLGAIQFLKLGFRFGRWVLVRVGVVRDDPGADAQGEFYGRK